MTKRSDLATNLERALYDAGLKRGSFQFALRIYDPVLIGITKEIVHVGDGKADAEHELEALNIDHFMEQVWKTKQYGSLLQAASNPARKAKAVVLTSSGIKLIPDEVIAVIVLSSFDGVERDSLLRNKLSKPRVLRHFLRLWEDLEEKNTEPQKMCSVA